MVLMRGRMATECLHCESNLKGNRRGIMTAERRPENVYIVIRRFENLRLPLGDSAVRN